MTDLWQLSSDIDSSDIWCNLYKFDNKNGNTYFNNYTSLNT